MAYVIIFWLGTSIIVGIIGMERKIGFLKAFLASLILSPLSGLIVTLSSEDAKSPIVNILEGASKRPSSEGNNDSSRVPRLGYSLCALLDEAKRNKLYTDEENFPIIAKILPQFAQASNKFHSFIESQEPHLLETLMHHSCKYLWGKAIEATLLFADSEDGNISLNFAVEEMVNQSITTDLPTVIENIVKSSMEEFKPYFMAHQNAMIKNQKRMSPDHLKREINTTLLYFPRIGMAYAISKNYHRQSRRKRFWDAVDKNYSI